MGYDVSGGDYSRAAAVYIVSCFGATVHTDAQQLKPKKKEHSAVILLQSTTVSRIHELHVRPRVDWVVTRISLYAGGSLFEAWFLPVPGFALECCSAPPLPRPRHSPPSAIQNIFAD